MTQIPPCGSLSVGSGTVDDFVELTVDGIPSSKKDFSSSSLVSQPRRVVSSALLSWSAVVNTI